MRDRNDLGNVELVEGKRARKPAERYSDWGYGGKDGNYELPNTSDEESSDDEGDEGTAIAMKMASLIQDIKMK